MRQIISKFLCEAVLYAQINQILEFKGSDTLIDQDKKINERETEAEREFSAFIKESRHKALLHNFISVAAKSYIDGMQAAIRCFNAATTAATA